MHIIYKHPTYIHSNDDKLKKIGIYMHKRCFIILHIVLTRKWILYSYSYGSFKNNSYLPHFQG
jgi:hypothetical protein